MIPPRTSFEIYDNFLLYIGLLSGTMGFGSASKLVFLEPTDVSVLLTLSALLLDRLHRMLGYLLAVVYTRYAKNTVPGESFCVLLGSVCIWGVTWVGLNVATDIRL